MEATPKLSSEQVNYEVLSPLFYGRDMTASQLILGGRKRKI
jgi:hypothetical protein